MRLGLNKTAHKHGKAEDMTTRGASSGEGDVMQVIFLTEAEDMPSARYLEIAKPKKRFVPKVDSIKVEGYIDTMEVEDEWGEWAEGCKVLR